LSNIEKINFTCEKEKKETQFENTIQVHNEQNYSRLKEEEQEKTVMSSRAEVIKLKRSLK